MSRQFCLLLALPVAFFVSPPLYAQHGSAGGHSGGHFGGGSFSGHSVGHSVGHSFGHIFGHRSGEHGSRLGKVPGSHGELPLLAGAAFIHGKVMVLPGPTRAMAQDGQSRRPTPARFIAGAAPRMPFRANQQFDTGFCDSFSFTWRRFLLPGDFDCFGDPFLSDPFFSRGFLRGHLWSDSFFVGAGLRASPASIKSPTTSDSSGPVPRNAPSPPRRDAESSAPLPVKAGQPVTLLQLRDGPMYGVTHHWVEGDRLHYVTDYGGENSVPFDRIDLAKTTELNAAQGTPFILPTNGRNP